MRELVESKNYPELYNCYAVWITDNRQFFTTGSAQITMPDSEIRKPFGFRSFLKTFITDDSKLHTVEQDASEYLSAHPDDCLLYTSPSPRDRTRSRMPSSA